MAAGASRAQESQVRRRLPGGLGKGRACGWSCKSVHLVFCEAGFEREAGKPKRALKGKLGSGSGL